MALHSSSRSSVKRSMTHAARTIVAQGNDGIRVVQQEPFEEDHPTVFVSGSRRQGGHAKVVDRVPGCTLAEFLAKKRTPVVVG